MMAYIHILRPINLAIVVLTQSIVYYLVLAPQLFETSLSPIQFGLLMLCTAIIAGSGYLINDIYDVATDQINKPEKCYIPIQISMPTAWGYYYFWISLGMIIATYLAIVSHNLPLLALYPLSIWLLWLYAKTLKKSGVGGNLVVAFMTSFVTLILIVAERLQLMKSENSNLLQLLLGFAFFSFLVNLAREWVKDIEDMDGDKAIGSISLPITIGIDKTKKWIHLCLATSIIALIWFQWIYPHSFHQSIFAYVFVVAPMVKAAIKLSNGREKTDYHKTANFLKLILFAGMIYLLLFSPIVKAYGIAQ